MPMKMFEFQMNCSSRVCTDENNTPKVDGAPWADGTKCSVDRTESDSQNGSQSDYWCQQGKCVKAVKVGEDNDQKSSFSNGIDADATTIFIFAMMTMIYSGVMHN